MQVNDKDAGLGALWHFSLPTSSLSERSVPVGHFNGVSDSGLIESNRGGLVSSQDLWPLPVPLLWEQARVTQATHLYSIHPVLSLWKGRHSRTLPLSPHHTSSPGTFVVTGKVPLAFRRVPLCVPLCRCSCASLIWGEEMLGKSTCRSRSPPRLASLCLNVTFSNLWKSLRYVDIRLILYCQWWATSCPARVSNLSITR